MWIVPASGQVYTWNETSAGATSSSTVTYQWTDSTTGTSTNWTNQTTPDGSVPNAAGAIVYITPFITGETTTETTSSQFPTQTIDLNAPVTVGTLYLGDPTANSVTAGQIPSGASSIMNAFNSILIEGLASADTLTFQAASVGGSASLVVTPQTQSASPSTVAPATNQINANIILDSNLTITNLSNTSGASLVIDTTASNVLNLGSYSLTIDNTNGSSGGGVNLGTLEGTGKLMLVGSGMSILNGGGFGYTGEIDVDAGVLAAQLSSSFIDGNVVLNRIGSGTGATAFGILEIGKTNQATNTSGQGWISDTATVTLNGGELQYLGTNVSGLSTETVGSLVAKSNYSVVVLNTSTGDQSELAPVDLTRGASRGTLQVNGTLLGNTQTTGTASTTLLVTNSSDLTSQEIGGGGAAGSTDISIVPWIVGVQAVTTNVGPTDLVTYDPTLGLRTLAAGEYGTLTSGTSSSTNVAVTAATTLTGNTTVNAIKMTGSAAGISVGAANTLTVTSGTILLTSATTGIATGTLNFGSAEGLVFNGGSNTISSVITGTNGLTISSSGSTLNLTGINTYSGVTTINGGGTVSVGNSTSGNLGAGNTVVAAGATLTLNNATALNDAFSLILTQGATLKLTYSTNAAEEVFSLSLDGGNTYVAAGDYTQSMLLALVPADTTTAVDTFTFTGSDTLDVLNGVAAVPEPSTCALFGLGLGLALLLHRRSLARA